MLPQRAILLVEDHLYIRRMLTERLAQAEYDVTAAASAEQALELFGATSIDLILTDLHLAGVSGFALASAVRKAGGRGATIPILAMTAGNPLLDHRRCHEAGITAVIAKPFSMESFTATVERLCASR